MDKDHIHEGITQFQLIQICMDLKEEMVALKTFAKMAARKPSERMAEEWLNSRQVMSLLRIKKGTLQNLRDKKSLPFTNLNNKIYYKASDVNALLKSNYRKVHNKK
jgi:histidinol phosphatase-like enzyme